MIVYWAIFAYFAIGAIVDVQRLPDLHRQRLGWMFGGLLIVLMVGLRYQVGADWEQYEFIFSYAGRMGFWRSVGAGDPGFQALNWVVHSIGGEIYWVNLFCAALLTWGLFRLARVQPYPWLAVLVAIPYMVLVVSMYTRQAAGLGILMAGLAALVRGGSLARFVLYVGVAALFHRTAIAILPLVVFSRPRQRFINIVGGLAAVYALYDFFLAGSMESLVSGYVEQQYSSQGAAVRIAMGLLAASLFLVRRNEFGFRIEEDRMWYYFSLALFAALAALLLTPSSTAVDRLSLYLMPLQIVIVSRLPFVYASRYLAVGLIVAYCFAVQFVWLNFAVHAEHWLPYQVYPLFN